MDALTGGFGPPIAYTIGVDIGQSNDPTAIAVVEVRRGLAERQDDLLHITRFLQRLPLGTSYPQIAERLTTIIDGARQRAKEEVAPTRAYSFPVYIDATGVGKPVVDILRAAGLEVTPVYFTHGDRRKVEKGVVTLGKAWLVSRLKVLFQTGMMRLPPNHPEAEAMATELRDYEIRVNEKANDTYGAFKVGSHDDLVTAIGLAVQNTSAIPRSVPAVGIPQVPKWGRHQRIGSR